MLTAATQGVVSVWLAMSKTSEVASGLATGVFVFLSMLFPFAWIREDRKQLGLPRSYWFNVGIVGFALVTIPAYLLTSRPRGQKFSALLGAIGTFIGSGIVAILFGIVGAVLFALTNGFLQS